MKKWWLVLFFGVPIALRYLLCILALNLLVGSDNVLGQVLR